MLFAGFAIACASCAGRRRACVGRKAIPGATLVKASPDFVGLTDVAEIAGFSRQNMRKLMVGGVSTFPTAVHEGSPAVWHLAKVLQWLRETRQHGLS